VRQRAPHQMFHAHGRAGIRDVAALRYFGCFGGGLPEVGDGEDAVGAGERGSEGAGGEEVGLVVVRKEGIAGGGGGVVLGLLPPPWLLELAQTACWGPALCPGA
jgi:hypothetical protein